MNIGLFDTRIILQQAVTSKDSHGQAVIAYADVCPLWARREETSGNEATENNRLQSSRSVTFTIRYRPLVTTKHRIVCNGTNHEITGLTTIGRRQYLEISTIMRES
jgi:SPP1 family predicted phage head-tail adaptor